jgi:hypothetical protein
MRSDLSSGNGEHEHEIVIEDRQWREREHEIAIDDLQPESK